MVKDTVLAYVKAINEHNIEKIYALMADDYIFIDTYDSKVHGKDTMKKGWIGYFEWFPDYLIEATDIFVDDETVAIVGYASATYQGIKTPDDKNFWKLPAAWKAVVKNDKILHWQVICDSKIPFDIINGKKG
ncbi:nuclear transport factor 2 family protein [Lacrimispora brassicae]